MTGGPRPAAGMPPGWPGAVRPPSVPGWERSAAAWLFDLCPADYRGHAVLQRHPVALVHLAAAHVDADLEALRQARGRARSRLTERLGGVVVAELLAALDVEEARLLGARRGVALVAEALDGARHVPRL